MRSVTIAAAVSHRPGWRAKAGEATRKLRAAFARRGWATVVCLVAARTDTRWWREINAQTHELNRQLREIYAEAKGRGISTKALKSIARDPAAQDEANAVTDYLRALGAPQSVIGRLNTESLDTILFGTNTGWPSDGIDVADFDKLLSITSHTSTAPAVLPESSNGRDRQGRAERTHRQARSISYRIGGAKFPVLKDIDTFAFADTPIDEGQVRELATGTFLDAKRNAIFIGGTGTGKTHLCIAVASAVIRARARGRFFNLVDLVNQLEQEKAAGRSGRLAEKLLRHVRTIRIKLAQAAGISAHQEASDSARPAKITSALA